MPKNTSVKLIISGVVQGVNFRRSALRHAEHLGVKGSVRNLDDGTVEVVAQGPRGLLEEYIEAVQTEPGAGKVTGIETEWSVVTRSYSDFEIRYE